MKLLENIKRRRQIKSLKKIDRYLYTSQVCLVELIKEAELDTADDLARVILVKQTQLN